MGAVGCHVVQVIDGVQRAAVLVADAEAEVATAGLAVDEIGERLGPRVARAFGSSCRECLDRYRSTSGRTSIAPPMRAAGIREANSIAASRSSASNMR